MSNHRPDPLTHLSNSLMSLWGHLTQPNIKKCSHNDRTRLKYRHMNLKKHINHSSLISFMQSLLVYVCVCFFFQQFNFLILIFLFFILGSGLPWQQSGRTLLSSVGSSCENYFYLHFPVILFFIFFSTAIGLSVLAGFTLQLECAAISKSVTEELKKKERERNKKTIRRRSFPVTCLHICASLDMCESAELQIMISAAHLMGRTCGFCSDTGGLVSMNEAGLSELNEMAFLTCHGFRYPRG